MYTGKNQRSSDRNPCSRDLQNADPAVLRQQWVEAAESWSTFPRPLLCTVSCKSDNQAGHAANCTAENRVDRFNAARMLIDDAEILNPLDRLQTIRHVAAQVLYRWMWLLPRAGA